MKRRTMIHTGVAMLVTGITGIPLRASAEDQTVATGEPSMKDAKNTSSAEEIFNRHMEAELAGDLDGTIATMTETPHLVNIPTMVGGQGRDGVRQFYAKRLIGQFFPPDVKFESVSRTETADRLVDEMIISFTHTIEMDHILPGVQPTGRFAEVAFVVIVGVENGKVSYEHIHWDQANLLVQLGLIDPKGLPLTGAGAVAKLRDASVPDPFFNES
jgi:carboxymethylenebutenolidase